MKKVPPSETCCDDRVYLQITRIWPSKNELDLQKTIRDEQPSTSFKPEPPCQMILSLLEAKSVPKSILHDYNCLQHACPLGLADPTDCIPPGHVFLTGILGSSFNEDQVFVTRFPCTESNDGVVLPVVRTKPQKMSQSDWLWLSSLHFGGIFFGNPGDGEVPLPSLVADGDLDGDLYFVCWDRAILSHLQPCEISRKILSQDKVEYPGSDAAWNENWFQNAQSILNDVSTLLSLRKLIGKLYNLWKQECRKNYQSPDAKAFGHAYKMVIESTASLCICRIICGAN